tara:strand:- start:155 stop:433 length:279 start_codon:yes stop_codon:yes gene_type:complete
MIGKIAGVVLKLIFPKIEKKLEQVKQDIIEHIFKVGKLEHMLKYVEMPNEADRRGILNLTKIEKLEEQMKMMAKELKAINDVVKAAKKLRSL